MILVSRDIRSNTGPVGPTRHSPVLVDEVVEVLATQREGWLADATVGGGGHAVKLLETSPQLRLFAIDRDAQAVRRARERLQPFGDRAEVVHAPFSGLEGLLPEEAEGQVIAILADFGVSSDQLDDADRGFAFQEDGPLDMRMDRGTQKNSAAVLLAHASEDEIEAWLRDYGEERFSRRLAHAIVQARRFGPLIRTSQLADLVERVLPRGRRGFHPATRTFQALRIAVNRELDEIEAFLQVGLQLLAPEGTMACISFHSLEDRRVKLAFRNEVRSGHFEDILPRGVTPSSDEVRRNPRARSARLRAVRKGGGGD